MYFVVSADRALNLTLSLGLPQGDRGFRRLSGIAIFANDASDGPDAILCFSLEFDCSNAFGSSRDLEVNPCMRIKVLGTDNQVLRYLKPDEEERLFAVLDGDLPQICHTDCEATPPPSDELGRNASTTLN